MTKKAKKILYITGTRADFGLMVPILKAIKDSDMLDLLVYATGMHLMPEYGNTIALVKKEFKHTKQIRAVFNNSETSALDFLGSFFGKVRDVLARERPDIVLTLGDRPEMLAVASACLYAGIPTAHIHGGERTSTNDEVARHAITKLSHLHFPATVESAKRIQKMGEEAWRITVVGAPALDTILHKTLPSRKELFAYLKLDNHDRIIILTQHPVSEYRQDAGKHAQLVIQALKKFNLPIIAIYPNSDSGSESIRQVYGKEKNNSLFRVHKNIEHEMFLALEREASVWVGNSSAALIESAAFKTPVVNVGSRQTGRQRGGNVLDVDYDLKQIQRAVHTSLFDASYLKKLRTTKNPWGDGSVAKRVVRVLERTDINSRLLNKQIIY